MKVFCRHVILPLSFLSMLLSGCSTPTVSQDDDSDDSPIPYNTQIYSSNSQTNSSTSPTNSSKIIVDPSGQYTTKDSVAAYLCEFDSLPSNYVGKDVGKILYQNATGNTFDKWNFNPWLTIGFMIGGDDFDNFSTDTADFHSTLPEGHYREADVDYSGANRGTNRLVYQSGCTIYYTADHYNSFTILEFPD